MPPRTFKSNQAPRRDPTDKDYLCSLHFRNEDVIKYYEISSIKGCPKNEVVKIERGTWTLKPDAIPCYFSDDNPNEKLMLHAPRIIKSSKLSKREVPPTLAESANNCAEHVHNIDTETSSGNDTPETHDEVVVSKSSGIASIDHNYHLPSSARQTAFPVTETTKNIDVSVNDSSSDFDVSSIPCESKSDPYSVEQLHQDVLEILLPKYWTFVQNDDDYSTQFISYDKDMSVKSVKFLGSCYPLVTVRNSIIEHIRVNSKQDIEALLMSVSIL